MNSIYQGFFIIFFISVFGLPAKALKTDIKLQESCKKAGEFTTVSMFCMNEKDPLSSLGFHFGCSRMLQYSIETDNDGRVKANHRRLKYDIEKIFFTHKFTDYGKSHINRKTLEWVSKSKKIKGKCDIKFNIQEVVDELQIILDKEKSSNQL
jgi:hypothetical protein